MALSRSTAASPRRRLHLRCLLGHPLTWVGPPLELSHRPLLQVWLAGQIGHCSKNSCWAYAAAAAAAGQGYCCCPRRHYLSAENCADSSQRWRPRGLLHTSERCLAAPVGCKQRHNVVKCRAGVQVSQTPAPFTSWHGNIRGDDLARACPRCVHRSMLQYCCTWVTKHHSMRVMSAVKPWRYLHLSHDWKVRGPQRCLGAQVKLHKKPARLISALMLPKLTVR